MQGAQKAEGLSGAEIENIINLAALSCIRKARAMSDPTSSVLKGADFLD